MNSVERILSSYMNLISLLPEEIIQIGCEIPLPKFSTDQIMDLFNETLATLKQSIDCQVENIYIKGKQIGDALLDDFSHHHHHQQQQQQQQNIFEDNINNNNKSIFLNESQYCSRSVALLNQPITLLDTESDTIYIIGDIHGNIHDLIRIFSMIPSPFQQNYLFLGDFVDRGNYSLDVVCLLFALKVKYPNQFHFIRGNHEFRCINDTYGFKQEIEARYNNPCSLNNSEDSFVEDDEDENVNSSSSSSMAGKNAVNLWEEANKVFDYLPLCVVINDTYAALHGGIGKNVTSLEDIRKLNYPVNDFILDSSISDIVWSDPSVEDAYYNDNSRGLGCLFGAVALNHFLKNSKLQKIFRGHQCVNHGVSKFGGGACVTVFSTSNYSGKMNSGGFVQLFPDGKIKCEILKPLKFIDRENANFKEVPNLSNLATSRSTPLSLGLKNPNYSSFHKGLRFSGRRAIGSNMHGSFCSISTGLRGSCNGSQSSAMLQKPPTISDIVNDQIDQQILNNLQNSKTFTSTKHDGTTITTVITSPPMSPQGSPPTSPGQQNTPFFPNNNIRPNMSGGTMSSAARSFSPARTMSNKIMGQKLDRVIPTFSTARTSLSVNMLPPLEPKFIPSDGE